MLPDLPVRCLLAMTTEKIKQMIDFEIENCKKNIEFYEREITKMQDKIERLRQQDEIVSEPCSEEELIEKVRKHLAQF